MNRIDRFIKGVLAVSEKALTFAWQKVVSLVVWILLLLPRIVYALTPSSKKPAMAIFGIKVLYFIQDKTQRVTFLLEVTIWTGMAYGILKLFAITLMVPIDALYYESQQALYWGLYIVTRFIMGVLWCVTSYDLNERLTEAEFFWHKATREGVATSSESASPDMDISWTIIGCVVGVLLVVAVVDLALVAVTGTLPPWF